MAEGPEGPVSSNKGKSNYCLLSAVLGGQKSKVSFGLVFRRKLFEAFLWKWQGFSDIVFSVILDP